MPYAIRRRATLPIPVAKSNVREEVIPTKVANCVYVERPAPTDMREMPQAGCRFNLQFPCVEAEAAAAMHRCCCALGARTQHGDRL